MIAAAPLTLLALGVQPPAPAEPAFEEIVVTGRRPDSVALDLPASYLRRFCFDPRRLTGAFSPPSPDDRHWQPLGEADRARLGVTDRATVLMGLVDHVRQHRLVLRLERLEQPRGLVEHRCTIYVIGGETHDGLRDGMSALFRGSGTSRHVGHAAGVPALPGWQQHVWVAIPQRGSADWREYSPGPLQRRAGGSFVVITNQSAYYNQSDYVLGDLKVRTTGGPRVSILSLAVTGYERRRPTR